MKKLQKKLNPAFWLLLSLSLAICLYVFAHSEKGQELINYQAIKKIKMITG